MSETASDAWSTDVLASDNEEKQAETFSEFDDMSSVAEMGSNLDDVRSEPGDGDINEANEVTPLASGNNCDILICTFLCWSFICVTTVHSSIRNFRIRSLLTLSLC